MRRDSFTGVAGTLRRLAGKQPMKLVVGVVQDEDADDVVRDLSDSGLPVRR